MSVMGLNLRKPVVKRYWAEKNQRFAELCNIIEEQEFWCNEDKDVEDALSRLAKVLEGGDVTPQTIMGSNELLFEVLAYMKFSKALRLISWFDETYKENVAQALVNVATQNKEMNYCRLFLERLILVKDMSLLQQIYSNERLNKVKNILENLKEDKR